jgi:uroporphyrinogen-III synthase
LTNVKTLLLTRPEAQSRALVNQIETNIPNRTRCIISPLMVITPTGNRPDFEGCQAVLFTSVNGVEAFAKLGIVTDLKCYCVGARTAQAARSAGLDVISADGAAADLITKVNKDLIPDDGTLLHIRGEHIAGDLSTALSMQGFNVREAVLYSQNTCDLSEPATQALAAGQVNAILMYSPRSARIFGAVLANTKPTAHNITALCISENTAAEVRNIGFNRVEIAEKPDGAAMLALIERYLR